MHYKLLKATAIRQHLRHYFDLIRKELNHFIRQFPVCSIDLRLRGKTPATLGALTVDETVVIIHDFFTKRKLPPDIFHIEPPHTPEAMESWKLVFTGWQMFPLTTASYLCKPRALDNLDHCRQTFYDAHGLFVPESFVTTHLRFIEDNLNRHIRWQEHVHEGRVRVVTTVSGEEGEHAPVKLTDVQHTVKNFIAGKFEVPIAFIELMINKGPWIASWPAEISYKSTLPPLPKKKKKTDKDKNKNKSKKRKADEQLTIADISTTVSVQADISSSPLPPQAKRPRVQSLSSSSSTAASASVAASTSTSARDTTWLTSESEDDT